MWRNLFPGRAWIGLLGVLTFVILMSIAAALLIALVVVRALRWVVGS